MTQVPHTRGPWTVRETAFGDWSVDNADGVNVTLIANADPRCEGDARLIAAAPEMLAVLESVYVDLVDYSKRLEGAYSTGAIALSSCADQVAQVIAKAKGGAS